MENLNIWLIFAICGFWIEIQYSRCWNMFTWAPTGAQWWAITEVLVEEAAEEDEATRSASIRQWAAVRWATRIRSPAVLRPTPVWTSRLIICPSIRRRQWYVNKPAFFFFEMIFKFIGWVYICLLLAGMIMVASIRVVIKNYKTWISFSLKKRNRVPISL